MPQPDIDDQVREKILEDILFSESLPTLPAVASRLISMLSDDDVSVAEIGEVISMDVSIASKLLKVVNSAYYNFPNQIESISQAVSLLGLNAVQNLVLSVSFFSMKGRKDIRFDYARFWQNSLARAVAARLISARLDRSEFERVFLCGLLQNLGKLIFACTMHESYQTVLSRLEDETNTLEDDALEIEYLGVDHPLTSYSVTKQWGFPDSLSQPLKYHHSPDSYAGDDQEIAFNAKVCHLADILVKVLNSKDPQKYHKLFRSEAKKMLGLKVLEINNILKDIHLEVAKAADGFGLENGTVRSIEDVLLEANIRLSLLNMSYEEMNRKLLDSQMKLEKLTRELAEKNRILENLAYIDGLTEVHNHRYFQNFLDEEISRGRRNEEHVVSVLMTDIDHFKSFNDTHGHQVGDFVLKEFCKVILDRIRNHDLLARYGGEEFVLVLPETDEAAAMVVAEKIRSAVAEHCFLDEGGNIYRVTVSVGGTCGRPSEDGFRKNDLIGNADEALYDAKKAGRNRVAFYAPADRKGWFSF